MEYKRHRKLILLFAVLLILLTIIPSCITAAENESANDSQIILSDTTDNSGNDIETNKKTLNNAENNAKTYSDIEDNTDYYFDINANDDYGDGTKDNPYKNLKNKRIFNYTNIHLANGHYSYSQINSYKNIAIYGEDAEKTIINGNGGILIVDERFVLRDITLFNITIFNKANLKAYNTIFDSSSTITHNDDGYGGAIYSTYNTELYFKNCTFKDCYAEYGGAIYMDRCNLDIIDSKFLNNYANIFGGSIFSLNSSIQISNTNFINNSAKYEGGAIYQIYTTLTIDTSNLVNNTGRNGGSIYSALSKNTIIKNNKFNNNYANNYGGALFIDDYALQITNNNFKNNIAGIDGGAVYSISNSTIQNIIQDNIYNNNSGAYLYENPSIIFISNGNYTLYYNNINYNGEIPSKYDLRDYGYVTPVKDQGSGGNCWAFYSLAALESSILKSSGIDSIDLSEENMKNLISLYSPYGWHMETNSGGYDDMAIGYLTSWLGPNYELNDPYNEVSKISSLLNSIMHVQNIAFLKRDSYTSNNIIKEAILNYGAVATGIYYDSSYNNHNTAYYYNGDNSANHGVVIVGWDDNYSKYNFKKTPKGNGAWIAKNSWGDDWGDNGYFYVSYYDTKFAEVGKEDASYVFILNDTIKYDKNYQYDLPGKTDYFLNSSNTIWYKNIFNSTDHEYLTAVSTYFEKETDWELYIKVNNTLRNTKSGHSNSGYYTINLNEFIPLNSGDLFEVIFKITVDKNAGIPISEIVSLNKYYYKENISFLSYDGESWTDLYQLTWEFPDHIYNSQVACIKAFTILNPINTTLKLDMSDRVGNIVNLTATIHNQYGFLVDSGEIIFKIGDEEFIEPLVNGIAKLSYKFNEDINTTITAKFEKIGYSTSKISKLISNPLINTKINLTTYSNLNHNPISLCAYITDLNNIPVVSGFVTFEIDGKTYSVNVTNGFANLTNVSGKIGENIINAYYSDESFKYKSAYTNANIIIEIIKTKIKIEINQDNPFEIIANITDLDDNPTSSGSVRFNINGEYFDTEVIDGIATINYLFNTIGEKKIIADYTDLKNIYESKILIKTINVSKKIIEASDINLTIQYDDYNKNRVIILLKIPKCKAEYKVNLSINDETYQLISEQNCVTLDLENLDDGDYTCKLTLISSIYELTEEFTKKFNISAIKTKIIAYDASFYKSGEYSLTLKDRYDNPVPNREVFLNINSRTYKSRTNNEGIASFLLDQNINTYSTSIDFIGDDKYVQSEISVQLTFKSTIILPTNTEYTLNSKYEVIFLDNHGNPLSNQEVIITLNGITYNLKTDTNGKISLNIDLNEGIYEIIITNPATNEKISQQIYVTKNAPSKETSPNKPTIRGNKNINMYYNSGTKYTIRVYNNGKVVGAGELVTFKINNKKYKVKTNKKGYASLKITQKPGKYTIYATYKGYTVHNKITIKSTIITKNITKKKGKKIKFTAKLVNTKGKILKNKKITFKIKGRTYKAKTNKKGKATIHIKLRLKVGKYKIISSYGKAKVTNIIKIKK